MEILRKTAYARAGLVGNPSDGYGGKTISVVIPQFRALAVLYEWEDVELVQTVQDESRFDSIQDLVRDVQLHGYYGGLRLVKATIKKFVEYCVQQQHELHDRNFSIRYESNIPRQVGLAGSSAIIVAVLRCLMEFYGIDIPLEVQPSLALSVETEELGMPAGLQDRVIQVYEGLVYMDFAPERKRENAGLRCYHYERLDPALLPPLYLAYTPDVGKPVQTVNISLAQLIRNKDPEALQTIEKWASLTVQARAAILNGDAELLGRLMNDNFDLRRSILPLPDNHIRVVETARATGVSAKFAGSGGAIVGTYRDEAMFQKLQDALGKLHCQVLKLN
jgi:glucuronokinase